MPYTLPNDREVLMPFLLQLPDNIGDMELIEIFQMLGARYENEIQKWVRYQTFNTLPKFTVGDFNFMITWIIHKAVADRGLRYVNLNNLVGVFNRTLRTLSRYENLDVEGVLSCAKAEFIRRIVVPYENLKIRENGVISQLEKDLNPQDPMV